MRVTNSPASRKRRMRTIKAAKGFRLKRSKLYRYASDAADHGRQYAFRDRKIKKRTFRVALAGAHQCRRPRRRPDLQPFHGRPEGRESARSTARSSPTSPRTDAAAFGELVNVARTR